MITKTTSKQTPFKNVVLIGFTVLLFFGMSLLLIGCGNNSEEQRIAELAAEVPSDRDVRIDSYFEIDSKFNALELEMDTYEDQQEGEYRSGSLTWDDYRSLELQLEQIEERLDASQDKLENRFGIDD